METRANESDLTTIIPASPRTTCSTCSHSYPEGEAFCPRCAAEEFNRLSREAALSTGARVPADYRDPRYLLKDGTRCTTPRNTHYCGTCEHEYFGKAYGTINLQDACEECYKATFPWTKS